MPRIISSHRNSGFTLIETILYLGLLSLLIGGILISSYGLIRSSDAIKRKILTEEEANFLLSKIAWVLTGASQVIAPAPGFSSGTTLALVNSHIAPNPLRFDLDTASGILQLERGTSGAVSLNSANAKIENLSFHHIAPSFGKPRGVEVSFTMNGKPFEMIRFLRL
jgi:type II secretory pathway pseudopilin PulG